MPSDALTLTNVPPVETAMLIRRPPAEVFRAFTDPEVTTRFWFTKSSGPLTAGAEVTWEWEMYGHSGTVEVQRIEENRRLVYDAGGLTVDVRFTPWEGEATLVEVRECGLTGTGDEIVSHVADSTGGYTIVLCALKALLEHGVELNAVRDRFPQNWVD